LEEIALYTIVLLFTLVLPVTCSYLLLRAGKIRSLEMETREERLLPFACTMAFQLLAFVLAERLRLPRIPNLMLLGAATSVFVAASLSLRWKVSIHMTGIGGVLGVMFGISTLLIIDMRIPIVMSVLLAGLLGTARLLLEAHRPAEIYAGFAIGFLSEFIVLTQL
ncbi:MAG: hypothetical protein ACKO7B_18650, partial [Flavobacteriales bacterium]